MGSHFGTLRVNSVVSIPGASAEYRLVAKRGSGGFADVWEAEAPGGFRVALRIVRSSPERQAAELEAIEILRGIRHPHLLPIFGAWREQGALVIGMELADRSLWDRFTEARTGEGLRGVPRRELLEYLAGAASGIDFLNAPRHTVGDREGLGVQHRDIKPRNILLFGRCAKVGDCGMVRVLDGQPPSRNGSWTLAYAAPEFFAARSACQSDQYSLAVTYCHLRGGLLPFRGNMAEMMAGHMFGTPDLASLPEPERPIVARALSKAPEERWPDCRTFVQALAALADSDRDALDRLPDEPPSDSAQRLAPRFDELSASDFSGPQEFIFDPTHDTLPNSAREFVPVSDFQVCAPSREVGSLSDFLECPPSRGDGYGVSEAVSDFHVCAASRGDGSLDESGEIGALSDFQLLSEWSGEAPRSAARAGAAVERPASVLPKLVVPCAFALCAAAMAALVFWPRAQRQALAHRPPERAAVPPAPAVASGARPPAVAKSINAEATSEQGATRPRNEALPKVAQTDEPAPRHQPEAEPNTGKSPDIPRPAEAHVSAAKPVESPPVRVAGTTLAPEPAKRAVAEPPKPRHVDPGPAAPQDQPEGPSAKRHVVAKPPAPDAGEKPALALLNRPAVDSPASRARAAYEQGQMHLAKGSYPDSIAAFTEAIQHDPSHRDAHFSRGMAHHLSGRYKEALADYTEAIRRRADHAPAYLLRGRIHKALGALDRALADLARAVELRPDDAPTRMERAHVYHRSGDYEKAAGDYAEAIRLRPHDPTPCYRRGLVRYHAGDFRGAVADFDRAIRLDPNRPGPYLARSEAYARLRQYARAAADHDAFTRLSADARPFKRIER